MVCIPENSYFFITVYPCSFSCSIPCLHMEDYRKYGAHHAEVLALFQRIPNSSRTGHRCWLHQGGVGSSEEEGREELQDSWVGKVPYLCSLSPGDLGLSMEPRRERPCGQRRPLQERAEVSVAEQYAENLTPLLWADGSF